MARHQWADVRFIYAIREDRPKGLIKIGSAANVPQRLHELQRQCARPLKLVGVRRWIGSHTRLAEASIHHALSDHRAKPHIIARRGLCGVREWFHPHEDVLDFISDWPPDVEGALEGEPYSLGKGVSAFKLGLPLEAYAADGPLVGFPSYTASDFAKHGMSENQAALAAADHAELLRFDLLNGFGAMVEPWVHAPFGLAMMLRDRYSVPLNVAMWLADFLAQLVRNRGRYLRYEAVGITTLRWETHSCGRGEGSSNFGHYAAKGSRFELAKGMLIGNTHLLPGTALGCSCHAFIENDE